MEVLFAVVLVISAVGEVLAVVRRTSAWTGAISTLESVILFECSKDHEG